MYIIIITSNSCDPYQFGKIYKTEKAAEIAVKKYQKSWSDSDWYKLNADIIKLKKGVEKSTHGAILSALINLAGSKAA